MCELLAMSANVPTDLRFSLAGFVRRGGQTGRHTDGFGVAFLNRDGVRTFRDPAPGAHSPVAAFLRKHPVRSRVAIAHIRRASQGRVAAANTHPFQRKLWGRWWVFAHNGRLKGIKSWPIRHYRPLGTTDSEHAFCWLLGELRSAFARMPSERLLYRMLDRLCRRLATLGTFNVALAEGQRLYAHCSTRLYWLTRRAPFGEARLADDDLVVDFSHETTPSGVVSVIATRPLTRNETWRPFRRGSLAMFEDGEQVARYTKGCRHVRRKPPRPAGAWNDLRTDWLERAQPVTANDFLRLAKSA